MSYQLMSVARPVARIFIPFPLPSPMIQLVGLGACGYAGGLADKRFLANFDHKIKHPTTTIFTEFLIS